MKRRADAKFEVTPKSESRPSQLRVAPPWAVVRLSLFIVKGNFWRTIPDPISY